MINIVRADVFENMEEFKNHMRSCNKVITRLKLRLRFCNRNLELGKLCGTEDDLFQIRNEAAGLQEIIEVSVANRNTMRSNYKRKRS